MFGKDRQESQFSVMLAEEILRAELETTLGGKVNFYQRLIKPGKVKRNPSCEGSCSKPEMDQRHSELWAREVEFECIVGTKYQALVRVTAGCRLYSVGNQKKPAHWQPHKLHFEIRDSSGERIGNGCKFYTEGWVGDGYRTWPHAKNADNPCEEMCNTQLCVVVPGMAPALHKDPTRDFPIM
jgi:hypothetical protein